MYIDTDITPPELPKEDQPVTFAPEITLQFSDEEINQVIGKKITDAEQYYSSDKKNLKSIREKNVDYWLGKQVDPSKMNGDVYVNNIIHRDTETSIKNAVSRMPDIIVMSPSVREDATIRDQTSNVEQWLRVRLDSDVLRRLAKGALRDNRLKLIGIWKVRYDFNRHDVVLERLKPEDVTIDHTARICEDGFTIDNAEFVREFLEEPVSVICAKFPNKKKEFLDLISREKFGGKEVPSSSKVRYEEDWATMYTAEGNPQEITFWRYQNLILDKRLTPYYDYAQASLPQLPGTEKPVQRNYFDRPRKPYILFSGENLGNDPIDDATPVTISIAQQDIVNKRGQQITLINDWAVPKIVVNGSAISEEKAANITQDPREIIYLNDQNQDVRTALMAISSASASPALYQDLQNAISAIDTHFSTNPVSRGETVSQESGISKQISREGDLSAADDLAQTMIQRAVEEAAQWFVHLAKMFGSQPLSAVAPGKDGAITSVKIKSVDIPDDLQIVVKSNTLDKPTQRAMAMDLARMKAIDPYSLFEDLDEQNPKELTKRLVDFLSGGADGYARYLQDVGVTPMQPANQQSEMAPGSELPPEEGNPLAGMPLPPVQ